MLFRSVRDILEDFVDLYPVKLASFAPLAPEVVKARLTPQEDKPVEKARPAEEAPPPGREVVPRSQQKNRFTDDELAILSAVAQKALAADEIVEKTQIPARYVLSALTMLQVQGAVEERPGRRFYALVELEG